MVNLELNKIIDRCYDNNDGDIVFKKLHDLLGNAVKTNENVNISFKGFDFVTTSFVNSAFVSLLDHFDLDVIIKHISITDSNKSINSAIRNRLYNEAGRTVVGNAG